MTREAKLKKLQELEQQAYLSETLPHIFGMKHYFWSLEWLNSVNRMNFLCAANQIGKSSANIRKAITWATSPDLWPKLWPSTPRQFWYFYPSMRVANSEVAEKWVKEWLPRGEFKTHPVFGYKIEHYQKQIHSIVFNSGVTIYFRSYEQSIANLQTSSVHAIFADEEMPIRLYDEIMVRTAGASIQGHFHMVFTATLGQEMWREVMEEKGEKEKFPDAAKWCVTMYDCLRYADGSKSPWTIEKIEGQKKRCKSPAEIERRIMGRFVQDEGLKYEAYSTKVNFVKPYLIPHDWLRFSGVDLGSGGKQGHPGAIVFLAVSPDFKKGAVYLGWRGDKIETTAGDIFQKYRLLKGKETIVGQYYDWQAKDFHTIATRLGEPFMPAEKSHEIGEQILNVLFKNQLLDIFDTPELRKLDIELSNLRIDTPKGKAKDDFTDALRYASTRVPWDFSCLEHGMDIDSALMLVAKTGVTFQARGRAERGKTVFTPEVEDSYDEELTAANELMEYDWGDF